MKPLVFAICGAALVLMLAVGPAAAQGRQRPSGGGSSGGGSTGGGSTVRSGGGSSGGTAVPRGSSGGSSTSGSGGGSVYSGGGSRTSASGSSGGQVVPRGARPRNGADARHNYHYAPYNPYFLYGYGAFGLGYLYYDPFWWGYGYPGYYGDPYGYGGYDAGYGYGYYGDDNGPRQATGPQGGLKLKVKPSDAEVHVDGYYVGVVNDFDGVFEQLSLEAGVHRIEIRANGYQTLSFEVKIEQRDVITYRGELQALSRRQP